jgi:hypothetical protein
MEESIENGHRRAGEFDAIAIEPPPGCGRLPRKRPLGFGGVGAAANDRGSVRVPDPTAREKACLGQRGAPRRLWKLR